jgi:hypothetical protein
MIEEKLTSKLLERLDEMSVGELVTIYGEPSRWTEYVPPQGYWSPGDERPAVVPETPAVAQAIGRCVAARVRWLGDDPNRALPASVTGSGMHPGTCTWCDFPIAELLKATDYAAWQSHLVAVDELVWVGRFGNYHRSTGKTGEYANPEWAAFFDGATPATSHRPPSERAHLAERRASAIAEAAGYAVRVSA